MSGDIEIMAAASSQPEKRPMTETKEIEDYPEGGYGWIVVIASACIFFNGWGLSNAWGIFQTYYEPTFPSTSASVISLIGSLQAAMIEGTGMLVGVLMDKFGLRPVMIAGAILQIGALLATSFCTSIWQLYLAQGLAFGLGAGTLYIVAVAVPGQYFHKRKATAYGILYTSSALGGIIWPILLAQLLPRIGYGWTIRVVMFISAVQIILACLFLRERAVPKDHIVTADQKSPLSTSIYRDWKLWYIALGYTILSVGMLSPMFFIGTFAHILGMSDHLSFYMLALLNTASIPGRTICGILADKYGRFNVLLLSILMAAMVQMIMWSLITTNAGIITFACLYGWAFGGLISLMPSITAQTLGQHHLASKFGVVSAFGGGGALLGAPIAALWIGNTRESYLGCIMFSGGFMLLATIWLGFMRFKLDRRIWVKL